MMKSGDYDALILHAVDVKDPKWAHELHAKKVALKQAEDEAREELGLSSTR